MEWAREQGELAVPVFLESKPVRHESPPNLCRTVPARFERQIHHFGAAARRQPSNSCSNPDHARNALHSLEQRVQAYRVAIFVCDTKKEAPTRTQDPPYFPQQLSILRQVFNDAATNGRIKRVVRVRNLLDIRLLVLPPFRDTGSTGLGFAGFNHGRCSIDAHTLQSAAREIERQEASPAAYVDDP
jgi:hypothetical protein